MRVFFISKFPVITSFPQKFPARGFLFYPNKFRMLRAWVFIFPDVEKKSFLGRGGIWQVPGTTAISLVVPSTWAFHIPFVRLILIVRPPQRASPRGGGGTPRINSDPAVLHRKAGMLRVLVGMFPCISHFRPLCEARLNNQEIQPNNMS